MLTLLALLGCNQILGIEVQKLDDGGPTDGGDESDAGTDAGEEVFDNPSEDDCKEYCDVLDKACSPMGSNAAYKERGYCLGLCSYMRHTETPAKIGNTFNCRLRHAMLAQSIGTSDNADECKSSGAGGNGTPSAPGCGTNCEGYCQLYAAVCAAYPELQRGETCLSECEKLAVDSTKNAFAAFSMGADTLQCRLAHLGAASVDPTTATTHCPHSTIAPLTGSPCQPTIPVCEHYCALVMNTCTGKLQQYDSESDCLETCRSGMTLNEPLNADETAGDQSHDTVACRRYHAYNALKAPDSTHCEHAGPSGDGHCGRICPAYCKLAKAACGAMFTAKFPREQDCLTNCGERVGTQTIMNQADQHFSVANAKKAGTINCRIYHATKAFKAATSECPSALGEGDCE